MLALVTCHIFPPQSDTEKKWIPGTWLPGWQLAVFQSPRLHECGPADAHGNAQPFCMDKCIFRKKRLFCNLATRWNKILQFVPSFPIYGWLTWWCDFFPVRPAFEDHPQEFGPKKVQPLGFYFWHLRLGLFKSPFFGWWSWTYVVVPLLQGQMYFPKKNLFCNLGALTQNSWIRPIMSYLWMIGLVMRLFSCGPTFEDHPQVFSQKKVQPLGFYFWHLRLGLFKSLFWLVKLNICVCTLLQGQMYFQQKKKCFAIWARWHKILEFVPSCPICGWLAWWCDFFPVGQPLKIIRKYSVKKGPVPWILFLTPAPRPLQVTFFLVGEAEHMWLYPFCKDKCIFRKKKPVLQFGRVDTKFLNSFHHVLSVDDWPGDATFFLWANLWRSSAVFSQKRSSPLDFIFDPCALASWSHFFGWWRWTYAFVPFCKIM